MKVQKKKCNQCLFSKNFVVKNEERRTQIIKECLRKDTFFVCHKSSLASEDGHGDVCCRGYWDNFKHEFNLGRIAQRLNVAEEVVVI